MQQIIFWISALFFLHGATVPARFQQGSMQGSSVPCWFEMEQDKKERKLCLNVRVLLAVIRGRRQKRSRNENSDPLSRENGGDCFLTGGGRRIVDTTCLPWARHTALSGSDTGRCQYNERLAGSIAWQKDSWSIEDLTNEACVQEEFKMRTEIFLKSFWGRLGNAWEDFGKRMGSIRQPLSKQLGNVCTLFRSFCCFDEANYFIK